jgi:NADH-quinone oxidoreductase subunit N
MWLSIPSKRHPDMGQTDEQHDEYVLHIDRILRGEEETYQFRRFGLFPLVISSAAVDDLSCCINSNLATAAAYGAELLTALLPEVTLLSMLVYLIKVIGIELGYGRRKKPLAIETLAAAQEALAFVIWLYLLQVYFTETTPILGGYFFWTSGIVVSKFFVAITSFFILHASEDFLRRNRRHLLEYPVMLLLAILLLLCLIGANNLMTVFLTIGGFSICLYVLILFDVYARTTREAAMKYFYLSAMSAGLIVFGTFLVYSTAGTVMFADLRWIFLTAANNINLVSGAGLAFLLFGLFFKLSAFPAHLWAVEVYEGSPAPVMAFFLLPVKMAVLFLFVRLLNTAFIGLADLWLPCLAVACAGSLL